ncbi:hypothetical protein [Methylorubrum sp. SB2]|uniref:hypothetical protein n=1 Tax=Methylorubrum subtropicum TaxID=3138812 RepID=UPI00313BEF59
MFLRPDVSNGPRKAAAVTARVRAGNPERVDGLRRLVWQAGSIGEGQKIYPAATAAGFRSNVSAKGRFRFLRRFGWLRTPRFPVLLISNVQKILRFKR